MSNNPSKLTPKTQIGLQTTEIDRVEQDIIIAGVEIAKEIGGPSGLEPTRYGDWEKKGRCIDF